MIFYILSIVLLTLGFWGLYTAKIIAFCPICASVVLTWIGGILALALGLSFADPLIIAILMGLSLGAVANKYGHKLGLLWKTFIVLSGFPAIYFFVQKNWLKGIALVVGMLIITLLLPKNKPKLNNKTDLFEECC